MNNLKNEIIKFEENIIIEKQIHEEELNNIVKRLIIPQITIFEELLQFLNDDFYDLELIDKIIISNKLNNIHSSLDCNYDDVLHFNQYCNKSINDKNNITRN